MLISYIFMGVIFLVYVVDLNEMEIMFKQCVYICI